MKKKTKGRYRVKSKRKMSKEEIAKRVWGVIVEEIKKNIGV